MDTIPSDTVCYPAKLAHGHMADLLSRGIKTIFYPSIPYQPKEYEGANNRFNCPIVTSYPDTIKNNMDDVRENGVTFLHPFFNLDNRKSMPGRIFTEFKSYGITRKQAEEAVEAAYAAQEQYWADIRKKGEETLAWMKETGNPWHRSCRASLSYRPGNQPRHPLFDHRIRYGGFNRRQRCASGQCCAASTCSGPVGFPFPAL